MREHFLHANDIQRPKAHAESDATGIEQLCDVADPIGRRGPLKTARIAERAWSARVRDCLKFRAGCTHMMQRLFPRSGRAALKVANASVRAASARVRGVHTTPPTGSSQAEAAVKDAEGVNMVLNVYCKICTMKLTEIWY